LAARILERDAPKLPLAAADAQPGRGAISTANARKRSLGDDGATWTASRPPSALRLYWPR